MGGEVQPALTWDQEIQAWLRWQGGEEQTIRALPGLLLVSVLCQALNFISTNICIYIGRQPQTLGEPGARGTVWSSGQVPGRGYTWTLGRQQQWVLRAGSPAGFLPC